MRVAALYDIHGNVWALEAVLADLDRLRPDVILIGGDVVFGPAPVATLLRLKELGDRARFIRGNADREVASALEVREKPVPWWPATRWVAEQLSDADRSTITAWPLTETIEIDELGTALFCHATPRSDEEIVTRNTPDARLAEVLSGQDPGTIVCGHTHVQYDRIVGRTRLVNAGSVGMAYEGRPGAHWVMLGPEVTLMRTAFDVERAAHEIRSSGFPGAEQFVDRFLVHPPTAEWASQHFESMAVAQRS